MVSSFKVENGKVTWGGQQNKISKFGLVLNTDAGMGNPRWGKTITLFFDMARDYTDKTLQLSTEVNLSNPPFNSTLAGCGLGSWHVNLGDGVADY